jgi:hypothetical protein
MLLFDDFQLTSFVTMKSYHVLHKSIISPCVMKPLTATAGIISRPGRSVDLIIEGELVMISMMPMNDENIDSAYKSISAYVDFYGKINGPWELQVYQKGSCFGIILMEIS